MKELTPEQKNRYTAVYCGICRRIRQQSSNLCRLGLSYDMAFLALLLMSLYEPEEAGGDRACNLHPLHPRPWVDNEYVRYAADMNVALACFKAEDDWQDDHSLSAKWMAGIFGGHSAAIEGRYPRQWAAIRDCIRGWLSDEYNRENYIESAGGSPFRSKAPWCGRGNRRLQRRGRVLRCNFCGKTPR
jgi:hypothetical protein